MYRMYLVDYAGVDPETGKFGKVKALQWTLTHSFYAKALAVKRVTSTEYWKASKAPQRRKAMTLLLQAEMFPVKG